MGFRLVATIEPEGRTRLFRASDGAATLVFAEGSDVLLLDYACDDPERLGFRSIGEDKLEPPTGPVRAPDQAYELVRDGEPRFESVPVKPDSAELARLQLELRPVSKCRVFDEVPAEVIIEAGARSRFLLELPDGSVLLLVGPPKSSQPVLAYRFWSPTEFQRLELPPRFPSHAGAVEADGTLWLYGREDGALVRGTSTISRRPRCAFGGSRAGPRPTTVASSTPAPRTKA